jgi:DNA helicase-2/ATP-dependent DNA helicase PcrA
MIINSDTKIPIENHFRVAAGPGAGKTHWLVNHINNILQTSNRLAQTRKIACITYTNIAVDTILCRLGTAANQVEVSTIHSFLYRHIVKPYCFFLSTDFELNAEKLDGHDDTIVSYRRTKEWIENHPRVSELKHPFSLNQLINLPNNKKALMNWLGSLNYEFDDSNELKIIGNRNKAIFIDSEGITRLNNKCLEILESNLLGYKKLYWKDGLVDHNDILYFSYELIKKYPFILTILRAKFPYFLVDEFQDTNPIQAKLLNMIGESETIVGVIGDQAQSIYSFQGAKPEQFSSFYLTNLTDYTMIDNRRSTNQIIDVLNNVRKDIQQNKYRNVNNDIPTIIVGERNKAFHKAKELSKNEDIYSLSRENITSNAMKIEIEDTKLEQGLLDHLIDADSNSHRCNAVASFISAVELSKYGKYKEAVKKIEYLFKVKDDPINTKKAALNCLCFLLENYFTYKDKCLMEFYNVLKTNIDNNLAGFRNGRAKTFYETYTYQQLSLCVNIVEDTSKHKTIHKAKGDEFNNVLLVLEEKDLDFLLKPNLMGDEEHRVYYVAISRARERLFINVPTLSDKKVDKLRKTFKIIALNG